MMMKMRSVWVGLCLVILAATSCGFPRLPELADGGADGESRPFGLELLAGDIGSSGNVDGTGADARFSSPYSVAIDSAGDLYVADQGNNAIRKVTAAGAVTTLAGIGGNAVAVDTTDNLYVTDRDGIRKVTPTGVATILTSSSGADLAVDSVGNVYFIAACTIRKVTPAKVETTLAGTAGMCGVADGTGAAARFMFPFGVAVDSAGNVYVADQVGTIRKVSPAGVVTTFAGSASAGGNTDGTGAAASFHDPTGVTVDSAGNVYVGDQSNNTIRRITPAGVVTTVAGAPGLPGGADGTGTAARFNSPDGVAVDSVGNVYVADFYNSAIRKVTAAGVVTTLAGTTDLSGSADGTGAAARFFAPSGVAVDSVGNIYVADTGNSTIRKVTPTGVATTLAGTAGATGSADGTSADARFSYPSGVAVDGAGNVYVADTGNDTIRKITPAGVVTTLAGMAGSSSDEDGTGAAARFFDPTSIAVDTAGNAYVTDGNDTIRKITPTGIVTTLAGTAHFYGSADGTGAAARFMNPSAITVDSAGNVYVADTGNDTIRKITATGIVTTLAGSAGLTGSADGPGTTARFNSPDGMAVDSAGNVYVADHGNSTIRKVTPTGTATTVAGTTGMIGVRLGGTPRFASPRSLAIIGDSLVVSDANAILILRHGAR